jgi:hypothetical protein
MDTFRKFDIKTGILNNDDTYEDGLYLLDSTSGSYSSEGGYVWSEFLQDDIEESEAIYSAHVSSWIRDDESCLVSFGWSRNKGVWPIDSDFVVFDNILREYIHVDDSVFSEIYDRSIYDGNSSLVIDSIMNNGQVGYDGDYIDNDDSDLVRFNEVEKMTWFTKISEIFHQENDESITYRFDGIYKDILIKVDGEYYIPIIFKEIVYKASNNLYITLFDSEIIGIDVNTNESKVSDKIDYNMNVISLIEKEFKDKLTDKLKNAKDVKVIKGLEKRLEEFENFKK